MISNAHGCKGRHAFRRADLYFLLIPVSFEMLSPLCTALKSMFDISTLYTKVPKVTFHFSNYFAVSRFYFYELHEKSMKRTFIGKLAYVQQEKILLTPLNYCYDKTFLRISKGFFPFSKQAICEYLYGYYSCTFSFTCRGYTGDFLK